jgi:hypothetical protein
MKLVKDDATAISRVARTPLEVILDEMDAWVQAAEEHARAGNDSARQRCADRAVELAVKAAPYVHAKADDTVREEIAKLKELAGLKSPAQQHRRLS